MADQRIFISHASQDDPFVEDLRRALEDHGRRVWVDSRNLRGGETLRPEIRRAIQEAAGVIAVLSPETVKSAWVRREVEMAQQVAAQRREDGYRVVPLLLPGVEPEALGLWFPQEPVGVAVDPTAGGLSEAMPKLLAALGDRLPHDQTHEEDAEAAPIERLKLKLIDPKISTRGGTRRVAATASLHYDPADPNVRAVDGGRFRFTAPLGPIEAEDLRWYLERYFTWPVGTFTERAKAIEGKLPKWGEDLYRATLGKKSAADALAAWLNLPQTAQRLFSVEVDADPPEGAGEKKKKAAREAAAGLFALPWELLHDGRGFLFQGGDSVRVRRSLPSRHAERASPRQLPIRVLLVSPRPEDEQAGYIDHRISARPLVEALEPLGELAELTVLNPPTFAVLERTLLDARQQERPFDIVHFDGHGIYDKEHGLGALCFEDPADAEAEKAFDRASQLVDAEKLAAVIRDHRIPLVFLEACQTAQTEEDVTASVAASMLQEGVGSVVAMSHSVLVETARRFVGAFYERLAEGALVGQAMLAGQQELFGDTYRLPIMGAGELHLQDWFVPVLYQEDQDPRLVTRRPSKAARKLHRQRRKLSLGHLPEPPPHGFVGRSLELLALERILHCRPYAVVSGQGGAGKTTLAVELARWLVQTARFQRTAFVCMEEFTDVRAVVDSLGKQLLPEGDRWSVAEFPELDEALQHIDRALSDRSTLIVLDNLESVLPDSTGQPPPAAAPIKDLFNLCNRLIDADDATRLLFTTREPLPAPFDDRRRAVSLGRLSKEDAVELVSQAMARAGLEPSPADPGSTPEDITELVTAVDGHARALVLLVGQIAETGVRATTADLQKLMARMHKRHPDDRERSLYASVELSLRRLPPEMREQVKALAVFHGGAHMHVVDYVLEIDEDDTETVPDLLRGLANIGLGQDMGYGHLRLDPALPSYLLSQMDPTRQTQLRTRWAAGMEQLTGFLYEQQFKDAKLAAQLTLLELPNLLGFLDWMQQSGPPEQLAAWAGRIEELLARLGRPQALARVVRVREAAAGQLPEWGHAQFEAERLRIERLLDGGDLQSALAAAEKLVARCLEAGEDGYPGADGDVAVAHFLFGRVLGIGGAAEAALKPLAEAQRRFQTLADAGNRRAERMAAVAITEIADCLSDLGRLDEAAAAYEEASECAKKLGDDRQVAVARLNFGTLRMLQGRYAEAIAACMEARDSFEALGEPGTVATVWHQMGMVYREAGQFDRAEDAYRESLAIWVQRKDRKGEADSLTELGTLYRAMGRLEDAVAFYRQALHIDVELQDLMGEGKDRSNLASTLIKLERYDEARGELRRAIECDKPYGHAAEPWKAWGLLHDLERATGNAAAAAEARRRAMECFAAYRRDGGENHLPGGRLCATVAEAIRRRDTAEVERLLARLAGDPDVPEQHRPVIPKLQAILGGRRDPALAEDPNLDYDDAVELQLLLEGL